MLQGGVRPLTDHITVQMAAPVDFAVDARLYVFAGPDQTLILATAQAALDAHLTDLRRLDRDVSRSGLIAALHVGNVQRVELLSPPDDITISASQVGHPTTVNVISG